MKAPKDSELSDYIYVDRTGRMKFTWDLVGEIEGVFEWDTALDFFTTYSDGDKYGK